MLQKWSENSWSAPLELKVFKSEWQSMLKLDVKVRIREAMLALKMANTP
jgi:hypothetical protein